MPGVTPFGIRVSGSQKPPAAIHRSVRTDGTSFLIGLNGSGTRFLMPTIGSGLVTTIAAWVLLRSLTGTTQQIVGIGDDTDVTTFVAGIDFAQFNGHFRAVASAGGVFTALNSGLSPVADQWYFIVVGFTENAIGMTIWDTTHQIESSSIGLIQPGYNTVANPRMGVMASPDGAKIMNSGGRVDSVGFWPRASLPSAGPLWNNGQALEFSSVPAPFSSGGNLWANFNEASGALSYLDSTGTGNLTPTGGGLTRQAGAGF